MLEALVTVVPLFAATCEGLSKFCLVGWVFVFVFHSALQNPWRFLLLSVLQCFFLEAELLPSWVVVSGPRSAIVLCTPAPLPKCTFLRGCFFRLLSPPPALSFRQGAICLVAHRRPHCLFSFGTPHWQPGCVSSKPSGLAPDLQRSWS